MARFGRGQPHQPIFLRTAAAAAVVLSAFAPQIHVVSLVAERAFTAPIRRATVTYVRPSRTSLVPDRLPPQIHVVTLLQERTPLPGRRARVIQLRNPLVPPVLVATPAPAIHVASLTSERTARPRLGHVVMVRNAQVAAVVQGTLPDQIHVIALPRVQRWLERRAGIIVLRGAVVPQGAPAAHVYLQPRERAVPRGGIVQLRTPSITVAGPAAKAQGFAIVLAEQHRRIPVRVLLGRGSPNAVPVATGPLEYAITYAEIAPSATTARVTPHRTRLDLAPSATVAQLARHKTRAEVVSSGDTLIVRRQNPDRPWRWDTGKIRFDGGLWTWDGFNNT